MATMHFLSGEDPDPIWNQHINHAPFNLYKTQDKFIQVAVVAENFWPNLIEALELQHIDTQQNKNRKGSLENRELIDAALKEKCSSTTTEYWIDL